VAWFGHVLWRPAKILTFQLRRVLSTTIHQGLSSILLLPELLNVEAIVLGAVFLVSSGAVARMSHLIRIRLPLGQSLSQSGACILPGRPSLNTGVTLRLGFVRCASQAKRSQKLPKSPSSSKTTKGRSPEPLVRKRQPDPSKDLSTLLNQVSHLKDTSLPKAKKTGSDITQLPAKPKNTQSGPDVNAPKTLEIDENELAIQRRIVKNRRKLLWPGIWSTLALAGTCGFFAYLDARFSAADSPLESQPSERIKIPQSWFMTPTVCKEGIAAGWKELDKLTIGIVLASIGMHLLKKSPLPIWQKFIHITGEKKYTAFTYPFVHGNWAHLGSNTLGLCWFLPGVVHHFDGDLFHTAAFFASVPLITSYLSHFVFRLGLIKGIPLNIGSSGALSAILGAFCVANPDEKVWIPSFLIVRLDAKYCCVLLAMWELRGLFKAHASGNRPAHLVSLIKILSRQL
jgi:membrane associated rhomboid family serine protease